MRSEDLYSRSLKRTAFHVSCSFMSGSITFIMPMFLVHDDLSLKDGAVSSLPLTEWRLQMNPEEEEGNLSLLSMAHQNLEYILWVHLAPTGLDQVWTWGRRGARISRHRGDIKENLAMPASTKCQLGRVMSEGVSQRWDLWFPLCGTTSLSANLSTWWPPMVFLCLCLISMWATPLLKTPDTDKHAFCSRSIQKSKG